MIKVRLPSLVAVVGPTAVGKTDASIEIAEALGAEIVSADSRQIYRGMTIGTAKPSSDQLACVPHYLIDVAEPEEIWSLARFKGAAVEAIDQIQARHRLPLLVGGTGQYVTAILEGWLPPPKAPDNSIRDRLESIASQQGPLALHAKLEAVDPSRAREIDPANVRRVARALEIYELTGAPASKQRRSSPPNYPVLRL
ncbi:MAG: tRNA (adenosine(37)-N6)-dimethylallyltransferase MiaA, partial [Anaerolineales bacterium]